MSAASNRAGVGAWSPPRVLAGALFACAVLAGAAGSVQAATANLTLSIADDKDPVVSGATVTYLASTFNSGPEAASNVVMTVSLSPEVAYQSDDGGCTNAGNPQEWTCTIGPLPPSEARGITFTTVVTGPVGQTTASVSGSVAPVGDTDPDESDNFASQTTIVGDGPADLMLTMFGPPPGDIPAGTEITYTLLVENLGAGVSDQVSLDADFFGSSTFTITSIVPDVLGNRPGAVCTPAAPIAPGLAVRINCTLPLALERIGSIAKSGRWLIEIKAYPDGPMVFFADSAVTAATTDPEAGNNAVWTNNRISELADLSVGLSTSLGRVSPGQVFTYAITVQNGGPSRAEDSLLFHEVPAGFVILGIENVGGAGCTPGARVECGLGDIAPGDLREVRITGYVRRGADDLYFQSGVTVTSSVYDHDLSNNYATVSTPVRVQSILVNPSLESDPFGAQDWSFFDDDGTELWDCGTGAGSACSVSFTAGAGGVKLLTQSRIVHGLRGDAVEISGWSRTQGAPPEGIARLQVTLFNTNGTRSVKSVDFSSGAHPWQRRALTFVAPRNYYAARIQFWFRSPAGKVWFDRGSLVVRPQ